MPAPPSWDGDKWCELHSTDRHDLTECRLAKDLAVRRQRGREDRRSDDCDGHDQAGPGRDGLEF